MLPQYTAVIRTLGKAGQKYQTLLNSLNNQTHKPQAIIVYLAEGYSKPCETVGWEMIKYVPKGMVAQRALQYDEVKTEWILFLDDDMSVENNSVERLFKAIFTEQADVCAIDGFPHHKLSLKSKISMALLLSSIPRFGSTDKGYTINCIGTDNYNPQPHKEIVESTTNSGNAFLCRKEDFLKIHFEEDLWLDEAPYAFPEDKVMFYKMHLHGLKILTHFNSGFVHLDAGTAITEERGRKMTYSSARNNYIFVHKYFLPSIPLYKKTIYFLSLPYRKVIFYILNFIKYCKGNKYIFKTYREGIRDGKKFLSQNNR